MNTRNTRIKEYLTEIVDGNFSIVYRGEGLCSNIRNMVGLWLSITDKWYREHFVHYSGHLRYPIKSPITEYPAASYFATEDMYEGLYGEYRIELVKAIVKGFKEGTLMIGYCENKRSILSTSCYLDQLKSSSNDY